MEYSTAEKKGATDETRREATKEGPRRIEGNLGPGQEMLGTLVRVISSGKQALDGVTLEMGRMVAESVMLMECEEVAGPYYAPIDPRLQKCAHEADSIFIGDQKVPMKRPRPIHMRHSEVRLTSYERLRVPGQFSDVLLEKILRGVSAQKYSDTVINPVEVFGVSPTTVSRKLVDLTAKKLKEFQERSLEAFTPFAIFLDTIDRGGEAFLVPLGVDVSGDKMVLGFWQRSSENHDICEAMFRDLERRGLALSRRILFVTDGGAACARCCGSGSARSWCINGVRSTRAGTCDGTTWPSPTATRPISGSRPRWSKRATPRPGRCCWSWRRGFEPRTS